ncbi:hypothetical protein WA158_008103 [Blastocystis sp. Blastoise]
MSIGFGLIYLGFKTCQSFSVSVLGALGSLSMSISYFVYAIANFFVPALISLFPNERIPMIIAGMEFPIYLLTFVYVIPALCLSWGAIHGIMSALFWTAQGVYLARNSTKEDRGKKAGRFWTVYMLGSVIGNFGAYLLLQSFGVGGGSSGWNGTTSLLFLAAGAIGFIGGLILCETGEPEGTIEDTNNKTKTINRSLEDNKNTLKTSLLENGEKNSISETIKEKESKTVLIKRNFYEIKERIVNVGKMLISKPMIYLLPFFLNLGVSNVWIFSMFNRQIDNSSSVGIYMSIYSLIEVLLSYPQGQFTDKYGSKLIITAGLAIECIGLVTCFLGEFWQSYFLIIPYILMAISDSVYQNQSMVLVGNSFSKEEQATAISVFRMLQSVGGGFCYLISPLFLETGKIQATPGIFFIEACIPLVLTILSYILYLKFDYYVNRPLKSVI